MFSIVIFTFNFIDVDMFNFEYKERCEISKETMNRYYGMLCFFQYKIELWPQVWFKLRMNKNLEIINNNCDDIIVIFLIYIIILNNEKIRL
jgi:hypothetical protein